MYTFEHLLSENNLLDTINQRWLRHRLLPQWVSSLVEKLPVGAITMQCGDRVQNCAEGGRQLEARQDLTARGHQRGWEGRSHVRWMFDLHLERRLHQASRGFRKVESQIFIWKCDPRAQGSETREGKVSSRMLYPLAATKDSWCWILPESSKELMKSISGLCFWRTKGYKTYPPAHQLFSRG